MAAAASVGDPDDIPASQAVMLYERLERAGRAIAAAKTLLARRVADSGQWRSKGHGSPAEHLARVRARGSRPWRPLPVVRGQSACEA